MYKLTFLAKKVKLNWCLIDPKLLAVEGRNACGPCFGTIAAWLCFILKFAHCTLWPKDHSVIHSQLNLKPLKFKCFNSLKRDKSQLELYQITALGV